MKQKNKKMSRVGAGVGFPKSMLLPIKKFLEEEIKKLVNMRKSINQGDPFKDDDRDMMNSVEEDTDEQIDHLTAQTTANFVTKRIVQLRKALTRLKLGKYGICEKCGKMIDTDRLAINPAATVCIDCEREMEA